MVYAEAADAKDQDAIITAMIDISKCFDRLKWAKIIEAAKHFQFPLSILRSVLAMYAAPRRIRWGTTYSYAARVTQGALPGRSVAMHLLQLIMVLPFDVYQASITQIPHTLDIYADDITLQIMMKADEIVQAAQAAIGRQA
eukprot:1202280-Pyramimonas_sp.AAC.1